MDKKASEKKERLLAALDQGMVMIHLDARRPGVLVPASCAARPTCVSTSPTGSSRRTSRWASGACAPR